MTAAGEAFNVQSIAQVKTLEVGKAGLPPLSRELYSFFVLNPT